MPAARRIESSRYAVVVLPFVPVMPTTSMRSLGSPYTRADGGARARRAGRRTTTCGTPTPSTRVLDDERRRPRGARRADAYVVPVVHEAGDAEEDVAGPHAARVVGDPRDGDAAAPSNPAPPALRAARRAYAIVRQASMSVRDSIMGRRRPLAGGRAVTRARVVPRPNSRHAFRGARLALFAPFARPWRPRPAFAAAGAGADGSAARVGRRNLQVVDGVCRPAR